MYINAKIYNNISNTWTQIGDDIVGSAGHQLGQSVELNEYGNVVVVGGQGGGVEIWNLNSNNQWTQRGSTIDMPGIQDGWAGHERSVAINNTGNIIAVGGKFIYVGGSPNRGRLSVYKYDGSTWDESAV